MAEFPVTLSALRTRVFRLLENQPDLDSLGAAVASTTTTSFTVTTAAKWPVGSRYEINKELVLVTANSGSNPITVSRGYEGTTAQTHSNGDQARRDPRWLSATVDEAINVVLNNWCSIFFPRLVWDSTTAGSFTSNRWVYAAPSDALAVRRVCYQVPGMTRLYNVAHSDLQTYPTTFASTGFGFEIFEMGLQGTTVRVLYDKRWAALETDAAEIPVDFPADADDLIVEGAVLYLCGWRMVPKFRFDEVEFHREVAQAMPPNMNLGMIRDRHNSWFRRAQEVKSRRPVHSDPQVVWRGRADW